MGRIVGTREYVTGRLYAAQRAGQQVVLSNPRVLADGRWEVEVTAAPTKPAEPLPRRPAAPTKPGQPLESRRRAVLAGCGAGTLLAAVVLAGWAAVTFAHWVADHAAELLGVAAVVTVVAAVLARMFGGGGSGHCSGPNTGH